LAGEAAVGESRRDRLRSQHAALNPHARDQRIEMQLAQVHVACAIAEGRVGAAQGVQPYRSIRKQWLVLVAHWCAVGGAAAQIRQAQQS
jgi:hypothetical protein